MKIRLGTLRTYITELSRTYSSMSTSKSHGNNLYATNTNTASVKQIGGNVLSDEESEQNQQGKKRAACCLILSGDGRVLAVSRKDDPTAFGMPGGKVDPGEEPIEAAARELQEETGLIATNLKQVFEHQEDDGYTTTTFVCNVAGDIHTDESGVVKWVKPIELFNGPFGSYNTKMWKALNLPT